MTKIIMMSMSLRQASLNKKLIYNAHRLLLKSSLSQQQKLEIELLSFNDFPMDVYNGDVEEQSGIPEKVQHLAKKIQLAHALIIATPEYNGGISGPFKNTLDWVSRVKPMPWTGKHILLLGASPGAFAAVRGLWHTRVPLEAVGSYVFPEMFGLAQANKAFAENDRLVDLQVEERLEKILHRFCEFSFLKK